MPVTSVRGSLLGDGSVYRQLSLALAGGGAHSLRFVKLSPVAWQRLYAESHLLRGARVGTNRYYGTTVVVPVCGISLEAIAVHGMPDDAFVMSESEWDPSTGS